MKTADNAEKTYRFANTRTARYIDKQLDAMADIRSQREIAMMAGWNQPAMVSMIKRGEVRPPLDKLPALARALNVDPAHLVRLAIEDHFPEIAEAVQIGYGFATSANERAIIEEIRKLSNGSDPALNDHMRETLKTAIEPLKTDA